MAVIVVCVLVVTICLLAVIIAIGISTLPLSSEIGTMHGHYTEFKCKVMVFSGKVPHTAKSF